VCTLILAWRLFGDAPVVAAANRDEALDRESSPPAVSGTEPRVLAPRDERAGGTWMGYNDRGLFVAVTNRWAGPDLAGERSRGLLVREALDRADASEAHEFARAELAAREYDPFHLLVADAEAATLLEWDGTLGVHGLSPGLYVVRNVGWTATYRPPADGKHDAESTFTPAGGPGPEAGARQHRSLRRTRETLAPGDDEAVDSWIDRAERALGDHEFDLCVHGDGFGTRSSSVVALGADGSGRFEFADGPPCETGYEPAASL
jgi:uncharacterized protein with NRDE domain